MGAGWDQVRSRGPQFRSESGVDRIIRYLGGGVLPAVLEAVAVAVHLQDVNVVGEPVKQSAGEPLGAEHVGPLYLRLLHSGWLAWAAIATFVSAAVTLIAAILVVSISKLVKLLQHRN